MADPTPLAVKPLIMKDPLILFGSPAGQDFRKACEEVKVTPSVTAITWQGFGGSAVTDQSAPTWAVSITYVQDWESATSLSEYLFLNQGKTVDMYVQPSGTSKRFKLSVVIPPGSIGGKVNTAATDTVTLGVIGGPEKVTAV